MLDQIRALWTTEPVRCATLAAAVLVFAAAKAGVVVDEQTVTDALLFIVPILAGGEAARQRVTPSTGRVGIPNDDLLPQEEEVTLQ